MRNKVVHRGSWRSFALFLSLSGCTALSDCKYEVGQKIRTSQAWHEFDGCNQQCFTCDYRDGWKKGYYDVLTGGDGRPPVVPPKKYWKPPVFTQHNPSRQDDWYTGYQDGAACAKSQPDFHYVPTFMAPSMHPVHHGHETVEVISNGEHLTTPGIQQPMPEVIGNSETPGVESAPAPAPAVSPAKNPASTLEAAPAAPGPKVDDYEKDPEPASTELEDAAPSATQRLVAGYKRPAVNYVDQLVRNACHTAVQEQVTGE
jgi:hypothetical protein